eukprot:1189611-Prorocentrum_minimum.AAC.2
MCFGVAAIPIFRRRGIAGVLPLCWPRHETCAQGVAPGGRAPHPAPFFPFPSPKLNTKLRSLQTLTRTSAPFALEGAWKLLDAIHNPRIRHHVASHTVAVLTFLNLASFY